ncbi:glycine cleavage system protein GcvH [Candidatus Poribacteria bacterium]|nr:glycine cleavage system protein GcvH [Candidatus Poribacteria bacterium]
MQPTNLLYTASHEWIEASGVARKIGITDHAQQMLGDIVFVELPAVGATVAKGEELLVVESPKAAASVYAPVAGKVTAVNGALESAPETINASPYGDGWLVQLEPTDFEGDSADLFDAGCYEKKLSEE